MRFWARFNMRSGLKAGETESSSGWAVAGG